MDVERLRTLLSDDGAMTPDALYALALDAIDHDLEREAATRLERAVTRWPRDHRLWQVLGLARRGLLDTEGAYAAFLRAAAIAPRDPLVAHSVARTAMEAGLPVRDLYARARLLAPANGDVLLGESAALRAEGNGDEARQRLAQVLSVNPGWYDGHEAYARLTAACNRIEGLTGTVEAALHRFPDDPMLWRSLYRIQTDMRDHAGAQSTALQAAARLGRSDEWTRLAANALTENGDAAAAQTLFEALPDTGRAVDLIHPIRTLVRLGRYDAALASAERRFPEGEERPLWPYRALLWRLMSDTRWDWLEGDERLVGCYDLGAAIGDHGELIETLRAIHTKSGVMLGQSVRGGTQTDGHLLARHEPAIRRLKGALEEAVAGHFAQLPPPISGHPTLVDRRAPLRFAGAWSVRLRRSGFHIDHVHPHGWFSSAFYVTIPSTDNRAGWLTLGACRDLVPNLEGFRLVEPIPGRLVLFPSTMWHGTRPFPAGERMTVAFDIRYP